MNEDAKLIQTITDTNRLLRDLIIIQLILGGVGQREIRAITRADMNEVNTLAKLLRKAKRENVSQ
jgi:phage FluMu protein gp41